MKINGTPQPGRYRKLGGKKLSPRTSCLATIVWAVACSGMALLILTSALPTATG